MIDVNITEQKVFNQFKNGKAFTDNLADFTRNLTGSVMEKIRISTTYEVQVIKKLGQPNAPRQHTTSFDGNTLIIDKNDNVNWNADGFFVGQTVFIIAEGGGSTQTNANRFITKIVGDTIEINAGFGSYPPPIGPDPNYTILLQTPLRAIQFNFGLIENDDNFSAISLVTESSMGYYGVEIGAAGGVPGFPTWGRQTNFVDLDPLGKFKDFVTGSARARFVGGNSNNTSQTFEVEHDLVIAPWYLEGQLDDLLNGTLPDYLEGTNSLKYVTQSEFREVLNDPNRSYSSQEDQTLGSVAGFGESFNGFNNFYNVDSISYEEEATGNSADGILLGSRTKITIVVSKEGGTLVNGDRFGVYISFLPSESDYIGTEDTNMLENFLYDNDLNIAGGPPSAGSDFIKSMSSTVAAGIMTIEVEVEYSLSQQSYLAAQLAADNGKFLIGVQSGDNALPSGNSDRVTNLGDLRDYDESADIPGLAEVNNLQIYPPNEFIGVGEGFTDGFLWPEDGIVATFDFDINKNKNAVINTLEFAILALNLITDEEFILDSFQIDLSQVVFQGINQQADVETTRNYILKNGSQFNLIQFKTGALAAGIQTYECIYAQKVPWQDWIENLDVAPVFYDNTKPNNNLNNKASNYSNINDFFIRLAVISNLAGTSELGVSGNTNYEIVSPAIQINDYTEDGQPIPEWSGVIETFRESNMENLNGAILTGENTVFRCTWTNSNGPVVSLDDLWAIHRIEETQQPGYAIEELGNLDDFPSGQKLIPVFGNPLLLLYLDSGNVVTECLIDGSQVSSNVEYNISARLHNSTVIPQNFKLTSPAGAIKDTSGAVPVSKTLSP